MPRIYVYCAVHTQTNAKSVQNFLMPCMCCYYFDYILHRQVLATKQNTASNSQIMKKTLAEPTTKRKKNNFLFRLPKQQKKTTTERKN